MEDTPVFYSATGLIDGMTYHYRLMVQSAAGTLYSEDMTFTTGAQPGPFAQTDSVTNITATSAILFGTVNANNTTATATFEYGLDTNYGLTVIADQNPVTGDTAPPF